MSKAKLTELASVIRSKNSGLYELTLDVIFKDQKSYEAARCEGSLQFHPIVVLLC